MSNRDSEPQGAFALPAARIQRPASFTGRTLAIACVAAAICGAQRGAAPRHWAEEQGVASTPIVLASLRSKAEALPREIPPSVDAPAPASTIGEIMTTAKSFHERVYVDGAVVGAAGESSWVRCGEHVVRVGSAGVARTVHVPCGDAVAVPSGP